MLRCTLHLCLDNKYPPYLSAVIQSYACHSSTKRIRPFIPDFNYDNPRWLFVSHLAQPPILLEVTIKADFLG